MTLQETEIKRLLHSIKSISDTPDAEWLATALYENLSDSIAKYAKGHKEHGGSIFDRSLLQEAKMEVVDMDKYIRALEYKLALAVKALEEYREWSKVFLPVDPKNNIDVIIKQIKTI